MRFPLGDIIRALNPKGWLGWIFSKTKGISIKAGDHEILLDKDHGISKPGESKFDKKPHQPGPTLVLFLALLLPSCDLIPWPPDLPIPIPTPAPTEPYDCLNPPNLAGKYISVENAIEGRIVVVLRERVTQFQTLSQVEAFATRFEGVQDVTAIPRMGMFGASAEIETIAKLLADPKVLYVSQEQLYTVDPKDTEGAETWGIDRIDQRDLPLDGEYEPFGTGEGIHVDIIDTGVSEHSDFAGRLIEPCHTEVIFRGCNDGHGHGTHVAGTVGGTTWGVAKNVWLHSVRVLGEDGSGSTSQVIAGINASAQWARESGPRIANMSLGGSADPPLDQAVCDAIEDGVIFAIAAGNDGGDPWSQSPARVLQALTVGAVDQHDKGAWFSNKGEGIDIWAPGVAVRSAQLGGGSSVKDGTSMASPHVAGAAALHLEANPNATMAEIAVALDEDASKDKLDQDSIGSKSPNLLLYVGSE